MKGKMSKIEVVEVLGETIDDIINWVAVIGPEGMRQFLLDNPEIAKLIFKSLKSITYSVH